MTMMKDQPTNGMQACRMKSTAAKVRRHMCDVGRACFVPFHPVCVVQTADWNGTGGRPRPPGSRRKTTSDRNRKGREDERWFYERFCLEGSDERRALKKCGTCSWHFLKLACTKLATGCIWLGNALATKFPAQCGCLTSQEYTAAAGDDEQAALTGGGGGSVDPNGAMVSVGIETGPGVEAEPEPSVSSSSGVRVRFHIFRNARI